MWLLGDKPLFDPIDAAIDSAGILMDTDKKFGDKIEGVGQRMFGEAAGSLPYGNTFLPMVLDEQTRQSFFGEDDPTRYGTGQIGFRQAADTVGAAKGKEDVLQTGAAWFPVVGGKQLERVVKGAQAQGILPHVTYNYKEGVDGLNARFNQFPASYSNKGAYRFSIEEDIANLARLYGFGEFATREGKEYIAEGRKPFSEQKTEKIEKAYAAGISVSQFEDYFERVKGDGNTPSQERAKKLLDAMPLTRQQKSLLWEMTSSGWKTNPYA